MDKGATVREKGDGKASTEKGTMDSGQGDDGKRKGGR